MLEGVKMMIVQKETWAGISLLHISAAHIQQDAPVMIFLHGFMSGKEHNLHYAYNLVEKGVRVLLPDALYHGERDEGLDELQMNMAFWKIVFQNVTEVGMLHDELVARGYTGKVAIGGTSMGGITTAGCLITYDWMDTAAILMGAVNYEQLFEAQLAELELLNISVPMSGDELTVFKEQLAYFDAAKHAEAFERIPIFFWHGKQDLRVPFDMTFNFYATQQAAGKASNLVYMEDRSAGHAVSRAGMLKMVDFVAQHLA